MFQKTNLLCLVVLALILATLTGNLVFADTPPPAPSPSGIPRFHFEGHEAHAQTLDRYVFHHLDTRRFGYRVMFNREYLTTSDMWMGDVIDPIHGRTLRELHRKGLLTTRIDPDGYVHSQQHPSHAHDAGWPFPLWPQMLGSHEGITYGWHFQNEGRHGVWQHKMVRADAANSGAQAASGWGLSNVESLGIVDGHWKLRSTGMSPALTSPEGISIDAFNAPWLQLRWTRTGAPPEENALPYIEWMRAEDKTFSEQRRMVFDLAGPDQNPKSGMRHTLLRMYEHPLWNGSITRLRLHLAPGEDDVDFGIDSFFTVYDTRHAINNPIFILSSWTYFCWTGDLDFLRTNVNRMRLALRYLQTEMGGLEHRHIRNVWPGHDGLPGWARKPDGTKEARPGHGIGNNYFDLMPFGWDDMVSTSQYYAATLVMAQVEQAVRSNPDWRVPEGDMAFDPDESRQHAQEVRETANRMFWDNEKGRFIACIDIEGNPRDYGYTFLNLEAIWYGLASADHAHSIMDWISGRRIVHGDTSTGADIYHWRFGPRVSTVRNIDWYGQGWTSPESIPWGGQIQDGGAVLGFAFYDLWARLRVLGPENAWNRLCEILDWEMEVQAGGGYRAYYAGGKRGTTLQGGGTAGGIGIDHEFLESSLVPSIVIHGFLGLKPTADSLLVQPQLPDTCPRIGVDNLTYRGVQMNILCSKDQISFELLNQPGQPIRVQLKPEWKSVNRQQAGPIFQLEHRGVHSFTRTSAVADPQVLPPDASDVPGS